MIKSVGLDTYRDLLLRDESSAVGSPHRHGSVATADRGLDAVL
jgi:hypothetical protein